MRTLLGLVAVLAGCAVAAGADEPFSSKGGKFKVAFPKGAKVTTKQQDGGKGSKLNTFVVDQGAKVFVVMYMVLPENVVAEIPAKTLLDGGVKDWPKKGEKLVSTKELEF